MPVVEVHCLLKTRSFVVLGCNWGILLGNGFGEQTDTARKTGGRKANVLKSSHKFVVYNGAEALIAGVQAVMMQLQVVSVAFFKGCRKLVRRRLNKP